MKPISETGWTAISDYSTDESVAITPDQAGVQNVCVNVKDGFGTIKKKYFVVDVKYTASSNVSTISGDTIKVGESVTVNCAAEFGSGSFRYGIYTKEIQSSKWTTVQNFEENAEVTATFDKPGLYHVCTKAIV